MSLLHSLTYSLGSKTPRVISSSDANAYNPTYGTKPQSDTSQNSLRGKLGKRATIISLLTPLVIFAVLGLLAFLWYGPKENGTWHKFMFRSWITRAISVSALLLHLATGLQGCFP